MEGPRGPTMYTRTILRLCQEEDKKEHSLTTRTTQAISEIHKRMLPAHGLPLSKTTERLDEPFKFWTLGPLAS